MVITSTKLSIRQRLGMTHWQQRRSPQLNYRHLLDKVYVSEPFSVLEENMLLILGEHVPTECIPLSSVGAPSKSQGGVSLRLLLH